MFVFNLPLLRWYNLARPLEWFHNYGHVCYFSKSYRVFLFAIVSFRLVSVGLIVNFIVKS